jgi:hypothetical protein
MVILSCVTFVPDERYDRSSVMFTTSHSHYESTRFGVSLSGCATDLCVKVKWSRYTPWRRMGWELLLILNLGTRWGWVVSITPRPRFTPGERTPGAHCAGGWVGLRAGLDAETRGKSLCRGSNPGRSVRSQTVYWATPASVFVYHHRLIRCAVIVRMKWMFNGNLSVFAS